MKMATYFGALKPLLFWLASATMALPAVVQTNPNETFVSQDMLPYGFSMTSLRGSTSLPPCKDVMENP